MQRLSLDDIPIQEVSQIDNASPPPRTGLGVAERGHFVLRLGSPERYPILPSELHVWNGRLRELRKDAYQADFGQPAGLT